MSIRMIANELYQLIQKVEKLERQIQDAPLEKQEKLKDRLRKVKAERDRMRRALDGEKG
ncbi:hypothetical protein ACFL6B_01225 [Thermodesulfobacteriota bacterium]